MSAIFPGRFQPFHNGHLLVVKGMAKTSPDFTIVICEGDDDNLFTTEQVREMISGALLSEDIIDANIAVVDNRNEDPDWADAVLDAAGGPEGAVVWSGREEVLDVFSAVGVETKKIAHVPGIDSQEVRDMIEARHPDWRTKVPAGTLDVVSDMIEAADR